jgi:hypothetical protein
MLEGKSLSCIVYLLPKPEVMGTMAKFLKHESLSAVKKDK